MEKYKVIVSHKLGKVQLKPNQIRYDLKGLISETEILNLIDDGIISKVVESVKPTEVVKEVKNTRKARSRAKSKKEEDTE